MEFLVASGIGILTAAGLGFLGLGVEGDQGRPVLFDDPGA